MLSAQDVLHRIQNLKVLVIGDGILDRYIFGNVKRISREAPLPVFDVEHVEDRLGGACNTALNARQFAEEVKIITLWGNDPAAVSLKSLLAEHLIDTSLSLCFENYKTTVKERFVAKKQQKSLLIERLKEGVEWCDCILASDHGTTFFFTEVFNLFDELYSSGLVGLSRKPFFLDTRANNYSKISYCSLLKVNQADGASILGREIKGFADLLDFSSKVEKEKKVELLVVTLGERGCYLKGPNLNQCYDAQAVEISDVSGAGDTFLAIFALIYTATQQDALAARLANKAGARVVQRFGTSVLKKEELLQDLQSTLI
ncbi:MAG: PfkB family carbohydrate kinase [Deltaproteobacteria bacterium]|nr:PfkB family carbohydrate kinase [Deltaproteobacteria bacterium]